MPDLHVCRACLACNVPVYNILHTQYQDAFERIAAVSIGTDKPHALCAGCVETLDKCCRLRAKAAIAEGILTRLQDSHQLTEDSIRAIDRQQHKLVDYLPSFELVPMVQSEHYTDAIVKIEIESLEDIPHHDVTDNPEQQNITKDPANYSISIETVKVKETPYIQIDAGKLLSLQSVKTEIDEDSDIVTGHDRFDAGVFNEDPTPVGVQMTTSNDRVEILQENIPEERMQSEQALKSSPKRSNVSKDVKQSSTKQNTNSVKDYSERKSEGNKLSCTECDFKCTYGNTLIKHFQKHATDKPYRCSFCDYKCSFRNNLIDHMRTHTSQNFVICATCGYKCPKKSRLINHIRTHTKERPFKCNVCGKQFKESGTMTKHLRMHTGTRPFKCMLCDYEAKSRSHLDRHIQRHTGDKRFKCELCEYACVQKWDLKRHVKTHDNDRIKYKHVFRIDL